MKRKGSITFLALIIMLVILLSSTFLIYLAKLQNLITVSSINKIQSYYLAESKINKVFYDDKYYMNYIYPYIKERLSYSEILPKEFYLDMDDMDENDNKNMIKYSFIKNPTNSRKELEIKVDSIYNGIETSMKAYGPVVNDIFDLELPFINTNTYPELIGLIDDIKQYISLSSLPSNSKIQGINTYDYDKIILKYRNSSKIKYITYRNDQCIIDQDIEKTIFLIVKNHLNKTITLQIGDNEGTIELKGIIYVEGDLYINSDIKFDGILIVTGNIYTETNIGDKSQIRGIILSDGNVEFNNIKIIYNRDWVYTYGVYLPEFIKPRLEVYKKL